ncbi:MAG: YigZ family protein [Acidobacteriota bacterium]
MSEARPSAYEAPGGEARAEVRDRGSRFLGVIVPVSTDAEVAAGLDRLAGEFPGATHHCWAYRLGTPARERSADAGEPLGTAGAPILRALCAAEVSDALLVVVRWFGGTKLGRGGLVRAYGAAARAVLEATPRLEREPTFEVTVRVPLERAGAVKRLLRPPAIELVAEEYEAVAQLLLRGHLDHEAALRAALADLGATLL